MSAGRSMLKLTFLLVLISCSFRVDACTCVAQPEDIVIAVAEAYRGADAVFTGNVTSLEVFNEKAPDSNVSPEESGDKNTSRLKQVDIEGASPARAMTVDEAENLLESFGGSKFEYQITNFRLIESWKGDSAGRITTKITTMCCMCGMAFQEGETYLVYARGPDEDGYYSTSICSRTQSFDFADADIKELDRLKLLGNK